nr:glycosyltransferase [uncultured Duganella sp.]
MLWVDGPLTAIEELCIASFVRKGYRISLWTYDKRLRAPSGCAVRDAREILPEACLFLNGEASYAGFSDWFRYALLQREGGLYVDADVIAVRPAAAVPTHAFLVTERTRRGGAIINGNVLHAPAPQQGGLIDQARIYAAAFPKEKVRWSEIGPRLLTALERSHPGHGYAIQPPEFANPVDWWACPDQLFDEGRGLPDGCHFLHLYNDMWRRAGVAKSTPLPERSLPMRAYFA